MTCLMTDESRYVVEKMNANENVGLTVEIGEANFNSEVMKWERPVLVAFLARWSRPCQVLRPVLDEIAASCVGSMKVVKVDADNNPGLGMIYDIQSIPTLLCFVDGRECARIIGTASKEA